jgi:site-specific recombinase XerD
MSIKRTKSGKWQADINVGGRACVGGKRIRKTFDTKKEAQNFEAATRGNHAQGKPWDLARKKQDYRLSQLVKDWYDIHGRKLKDGHKRILTLNKLINNFNDPWLSNFTSKDFLIFRSKNTSVSNNTLNHYQTYLNVMFKRLIEIGQIDSNPIDKVKLLRFNPTELAYLEKDEIAELLEHFKPKKSDAYMVTKICLSTGARWNESVNIKKTSVRDNKISVLGKNGKIRHLIITKELANEIKDTAPYTDPYTTFQRSLIKLDLKKAKGQMTHILRHTFASHFIMNGGNILTLQKILDHSSLNTTMRYAHLAPEFLNEMATLNPINY